MRRTHFPILILLFVVFYSCKDNVVCPAFQSTYILNDSIRTARYSLFLNDSTPKIAMIPQRTKFGVSKKVNKYKKIYNLMTAPKENQLGPPARDSLYYFEEPKDFVASDFVDVDTLGVDSLGVDSLSTAPLLAAAVGTDEKEEKEYKYRYHPKNPYNTEQEYYNKYYGNLFVDDRLTVAAMLAGKEFAQPPADTAAVEERKGIRGWFNRKDAKDDLSDQEEGEVTEGNQLIDDETVEEIEASEIPESESETDSDPDLEPESSEPPLDEEPEEESQD